jgi:hypothetical protein
MRLVRQELESGEPRGHFRRFHLPIAQAAAVGDEEALRLLGEVVVHHPRLARHLMPEPDDHPGFPGSGCEPEHCEDDRTELLVDDDWVELEELEQRAHRGDLEAAIHLMEFQLLEGRDMVYLDTYAPRIGESLDEPEARRFAEFVREVHPEVFPLLGVEPGALERGEEREYRRWLDEADEGGEG